MTGVLFKEIAGVQRISDNHAAGGYLQVSAPDKKLVTIDVKAKSSMRADLGSTVCELMLKVDLRFHVGSAKLM